MVFRADISYLVSPKTASLQYSLFSTYFDLSVFLCFGVNKLEGVFISL